eukprot:5224170-Pleurochrysis_carterae.AAC.1
MQRRRPQLASIHTRSALPSYGAGQSTTPVVAAPISACAASFRGAHLGRGGQLAPGHPRHLGLPPAQHDALHIARARGGP